MIIFLSYHNLWSDLLIEGVAPPPPTSTPAPYFPSYIYDIIIPMIIKEEKGDVAGCCWKYLHILVIKVLKQT